MIIYYLPAPREISLYLQQKPGQSLHILGQLPESSGIRVNGPEEIRAQIQAVYDAGYEEWILWNAANRYTEGGLLPEEEN